MMELLRMVKTASEKAFSDLLDRRTASGTPSSQIVGRQLDLAGPRQIEAQRGTRVERVGRRGVKSQVRC